MKRIVLGLAASAAAIAMAPAANADPLGNGTTGVIFTTFNPATQGTLLNSMTATVGAATYNASYASAVYRNTSGTLDFYYQILANSISTGDEINGLTAFNFAGFTIDAFVSTLDPDGASTLFSAANNPNSDGPGGTSLGFTSTAQRNDSGATIRADFGRNGLEAAGERSATYIFRTNAVNYTNGTFTSTDGSTVTVNAFAPTAAVPEPATWGLMLLGFGAMGGMLRTRSRKARIRFA